MLLTKEQLHELTGRVQERIDEFGPTAQHMPQMSPGVIRLVVDVFAEWQEARDQKKKEEILRALGTIKSEECIGISEAKPEPEPESPPVNVWSVPEPKTVKAKPEPKTVLPNGNGQHAELSSEAVATLGPEHVTINPLKINNPPTLEQVDELNDLAMGSVEKASLLREIIGELQMISEDGEMPTMAQWNDRKPAHLPKAAALLARYSLSWERLAEYARLRFDPIERRYNRHKKDKTA